jgi:glyoxylase-like metal-dependent hydrolase (beta-lactamase superfamily II)
MEKNQQEHDNSYFDVADGVWGLKDVFVNVYFISNPEDQSWVLLDAGLKTSYDKIKAVAEKLFGQNAVPSGIVLTHGHFDHVGSLTRLAVEWNVPVYAHHLELPYLTGKSDYPPADSSVGGGLMSLMADFYPKTPIDLSGTVKSLPFDGRIAVLPEWTYLHTPGHAPGHISLWRQKDKVLLAGDAFVTTKQESAFSVLTQSKVLSGPPKYFTIDWQLAKESVNLLANLQPDTVACGHGMPMSGEEMQQDLMELAQNFEQKAMPSHGRYVSEPAVTNRYGVVSLPEPKSQIFSKIALIGAIAGIAVIGIALFSAKK